MAATFEIVSYSQTEQVEGDKLVPVREYHCYSYPSATYFQFRRNKKAWPDAKASAQNIAGRIENVLGLPDVTDVVYFQDVTPGGRLVDHMRTYYETPDGAISGSVETTLAAFRTTTVAPLVQAEIAAGGDQIGS